MQKNTYNTDLTDFYRCKGVVSKVFLSHAKFAKSFTQRTPSIYNQCQKLCALCDFFVFLRENGLLRQPFFAGRF
ncbi:MAG: hypothetical protein LBS50_10025 [Prevotellaceae bacterium]|nr:hypothetical protein [Prevotellaceae bacterium]